MSKEMIEIAKLRQRLKNVRKGVTEYRMTVTEAWTLLAEVDVLLTPKIEEQSVVAPVATVTQVMDGGTF